MAGLSARTAFNLSYAIRPPDRRDTDWPSARARGGPDRDASEGFFLDDAAGRTIDDLVVEPVAHRDRGVVIVDLGARLLDRPPCSSSTSEIWSTDAVARRSE